jgi:hypothetical protein
MSYLDFQALSCLREYGMTGPETTPIIFGELAELREKTEQLSQSLGGRLKSHLATLYPILAPEAGVWKV